MIPRNQRGVFPVSNLRRSPHGMFSSLQPAECCKTSWKKVGEDAEGEAVSEFREKLRNNVKENKRGKGEKRLTGRGTTAVKPAKRGRTQAESQSWG